MSVVKVFPEKYKYVYQSAVVFGATLFNLAATIAFAWSSPSLPKLMAPGGPILITVNQGTWIVLTLKFGNLIAPIPAAWMMDRFGRMRSVLFSAVLMLGGWITLAFAETYELFLVYAFIGGIARAFSSCVLPMYIAEISSAQIRGYLGVLYTVLGKVGLLLVFSIGPFLSIRAMALVCAVPVCLFIVTFFWLPESPYHLIGVKQRAKAERNLQQLRCSLDVKEEIEQMELSVKESQANQGTVREIFLHTRNRRNIIVVLGLSALIELSGSQIVVMYAETIFATLDTDLEPKYASIIFGVVQLVAAVVACFLVDTMGRRPLLLISIIGSGFCTMVIAVYYICERHMDVTGLGWIPLLAIMAFMIVYSIGILSLLHVITSELFPKHLRGIAGATKNINANLFGLILVYAYQYGLDNWGSDYVFMAFSLFTFAFVPFVVFLVPETNQKSLDSILKDGMERVR